MHFLPTGIEGAWVVDPTPHQDSRGRFFRAWCQQEFQQHDIDFVPLQANIGFSTATGTIRGMHFQNAPAPEAKLIRCTRGAMFDVVLDLRSNSPTFAQWYGIELTPKNGRMLFVPENCAHGYQTLQPDTEMYYMTSAMYAPDAAHGVRFDDPAFDIRWPLRITAISEQDCNWPLMGLENL